MPGAVVTFEVKFVEDKAKLEAISVNVVSVPEDAQVAEARPLDLLSGEEDHEPPEDAAVDAEHQEQQASRPIALLLPSRGPL